MLTLDNIYASFALQSKNVDLNIFTLATEVCKCPMALHELCGSCNAIANVVIL